MPLLTYKIKNEIFDNFENLNLNKLQKFLYDIDDLNCLKKAILVDNETSILDKIQTVQDLISKNPISNNFIQTSIMLFEYCINFVFSSRFISII